MTTTTDTTPQEPVCLWTEDRIGEMVDGNSFDVPYRERVISVVSDSMAEGLALEMRDEYETERQRLIAELAALEIDKAELQGIGWELEAELADTQRALAEAQAWQPVGEWSYQEIVSRGLGGSLVINFRVENSRMITMDDSKGQHMLALLRPDYAVCRRTSSSAGKDVSE